jgi:hypothetical protein
MKGGVVVNQSLASLDISKLKRTIKSVVEKAWKEKQGQPPLPKPQEENSNKSVMQEPEKLIGNELQERMTSARARTSRTRIGPTLASIPEPYNELTGNVMYANMFYCFL